MNARRDSHTANQPIAVGDLVQVVRWPCCGASLGRVATVTQIGRRVTIEHGCTTCSTTKTATGASAPAVQVGHELLWPLAWIKRIPPLSELEGVKTQEDIREPA